MTKHQIAMFTFTLGNAESIGPAALRELWMRATGIVDVSVERKSLHGSHRERPTYMLYAAQSLGNLREVELRLRRLLEEAHLSASLTALHG